MLCSITSNVKSNDYIVLEEKMLCEMQINAPLLKYNDNGIIAFLNAMTQSLVFIYYSHVFN